MIWVDFSVVTVARPPHPALQYLLWGKGYNLLPAFSRAECWSACQFALYNLFLGLFLSLLTFIAHSASLMPIESTAYFLSPCSPGIVLQHCDSIINCLTCSAWSTTYGHIFFLYSNKITESLFSLWWKDISFAPRGTLSHNNKNLRVLLNPKIHIKEES